MGNGRNPPDNGPAERSVRDVLDQLLAWREVPEPYTAGTHPLWTDPHIARSMLQAHLDPEQDAASRRPETIDATVAWLRGQVPTGRRVLDLGCGPGLYAERLAAAGYEVTGVDFSANSIRYAESRSSAGRYLVGDYRELGLDETFDAVLLIYLDYGSFSPADRRRILSQVRRWLAPDGVFGFDVPTPLHREGSEHRRSWGVHTEGFYSDRPHLWLDRTLRYPDGPTYLDEHVIITADEVRCYRVWERCFTPEALRDELSAAGFRVRSAHGDLAGARFDPDSSRTLGVLASVSDG